MLFPKGEIFMRVLLVEDDPKLNHSLKYQLEKENFIVDSCSDGEEALFILTRISMTLFCWTGCSRFWREPKSSPQCAGKTTALPSF